MNHKRLIIVAIWVGLIVTLTTLGRELPVDTISDPVCEKGIHWEDVSEGCKVGISKEGEINEEIYSKGNLILSALWGTSYNTPHKRRSGSHPSLDIVSAQGTPVNAINDGVVVLAGLRNGFGKSVTVKHTLNGEDIYSNYSHLETIAVNVGQNVTTGEKVGTIGRTGFTIGPFGYHLDFQITTADSPSHPYGLHDCETSYYEAVNNGDCREKIEQYTINPIEFFQKYSNYDLATLTPLGTQLVTNNTEDQAPTDEVHSSAPKQEPTIQEITDTEAFIANQILTQIPEKAPVAFNINKSIFASLGGSYTQWSQIQPQQVVITAIAGETQGETVVDTSNKQEVQVDSGLPYEINWVIANNSREIKQGKVSPFSFFINDQTKSKWSGDLDERISFKFNSHEMDIIPKSFNAVVDGKKTVFIKGKTPGYASITIMHGDEELGSEVVLIK